ncbi:MAG: short-subunit dehydrogenase, partial [Thermoproteota archaeon]
MAKKSFKDKIVWITGASSGIGEGLLYEFDKIGAKVIISSRKKEKLEEVKEKCINKDNIFILPLDLGDHDSLAEKVKLAYGFSKNIDLLINNGGISQRDLAMNSSIEVDKRLMNINYFGTVILSKLVIPKMIENKSGQISTVSSLVGKFGT